MQQYRRVNATAEGDRVSPRRLTVSNQRRQTILEGSGNGYHGIARVKSLRKRDLGSSARRLLRFLVLSEIRQPSLTLFKQLVCVELVEIVQLLQQRVAQYIKHRTRIPVRRTERFR